MLKITRYRLRFANGGLKRELDNCKCSCDVYVLFADYLEISHEESRIFRLINADVIIKDLRTIKRYINKVLKQDISINEMLNYKVILEQVERELTKKLNKSKGGHKADKTKKEPIVNEVWSNWCEIPMHGFSINSMYTTMFNRQIRSDAYNKWLYDFKHMDIPNKYDYVMKYGIRLDKPLAIEMEFICMEKFDVDNFTKSLIDALFSKWSIKSDNNVLETVCRRIGVCENYENAMIRFRVRNI